MRFALGLLNSDCSIHRTVKKPWILIITAIESETFFWGYDDVLGWAHAGAHYADVLYSMIELDT